LPELGGTSILWWRMSDPRLAEYLEFLCFPSISTDPEAEGGCGGLCSLAGEKADRDEAGNPGRADGGHPIVLAKNQHQPGRRTVMIYGHYDVQPVDPVELWTSPPFEPRIENEIVFARGAADNKGQIFAHVLGLEETLREKGEMRAAHFLSPSTSDQIDG